MEYKVTEIGNKQHVIYRGSAIQCLLPLPDPEDSTQPAPQQNPVYRIIVEPIVTGPTIEAVPQLTNEPQPIPTAEQQLTQTTGPQANSPTNHASPYPIGEATLEPEIHPHPSMEDRSAAEQTVQYPTLETILELEQTMPQYPNMADLLEAGPSQPYNNLDGISLYSPAETFNLEEEAEWRCRTPIEVERCCQLREMEKDWELENAQAELENTQPEENPKKKKKRSGVKKNRGHKKGNVRLPRYKKTKK